MYVLETTNTTLDFHYNPRQKSRKEKIAYIKGFFDAEGGIPHSSSDRFYIQLCQKDKKKIEALKEILEELNISTGKIHNPSKRVDPEYWRVYVLASSHQKFMSIIGSYHPKKIKRIKMRMKI
jgi:intein-encoded DNA endonuclease-like protein